MTLEPRSETELQERQRSGDLRVCSSEVFRSRVATEGLEAAYGATDVVVAANAEFTDQATLQLNLGPADPPLRLRQVQLDRVACLGASGSGGITLPIGGGLVEPLRQGGAQVLGTLLAGGEVELVAVGEATLQHPRQELRLRLSLKRIGSGQLLLHRGISENGVVAISSGAGITHSPYGPVLGPYATALYSSGGSRSIGLSMPRLALLGPGSPVLVGGAIGWVVGAGQGHQPQTRRLPSGHARAPGAVAAISVDLHRLRPEWVRPCFLEGHGSGLMVAIAAPIPLINGTVASQASLSDAQLEAPVLDFSIPRRIKPSFGGVAYSQLLAGEIVVDGRRLRCFPAHSPRLAEAMAGQLADLLRSGHFPLRLPCEPLPLRSGLIPLDP